MLQPTAPLSSTSHHCLGLWPLATNSRRRGRARRWLAGALAGVVLGSAPLGLGLSANLARAAIVERVVAVVGDKAILLSDLQQRARPFKVQVYNSVPEGASRNAALSQLYRQLVERLVDEELQSREAVRANISVSADEIEAALERLAKQNDISVQQLFEEAERNGLGMAEYRQEVRRQLLDAKMINLRVQGRIRISEDDMRATYRRLANEERKKLGFRAAWIRLQIPPGGGASGVARVREEAARLSARARAGADFAELARTYSSDASTREQGGLLAPLQPGQLPPDVDAAVLALELGGVTDPIRVGDAWVVLKLVERSASELPPYDEAKSQLQARVYAEKMDVARRQWLDGLRKRSHVDIRL